MTGDDLDRGRSDEHVRLLAPDLAGESHLKDIAISALAAAPTDGRPSMATPTEVLEQAPWTASVCPLEGLILHDAASGHIVRPAR